MLRITPDPFQPMPVRAPLVVALVYDGLCTFEFAIAAEVFGLPRPEMGPGWYRFATAAIEPGPLHAHGGLRIEVEGGAELLQQADLIVIPGWKGADVPVPSALTEALLAAHRRGARLASICSGAFVLAATRLLDERRATTHWRYVEAFESRFPKVKVDPGVLYVEEGPVFTSAGSAAGIDLMLHIVRTDFGANAANMVARRLVMPAHRSGGQAQFIERPVPRHRESRLAPLLDRVRGNLQRGWTIKEMAREAAMSERTFLRRFTEATGLPPGEWLIQLRTDEARRLLETTAAPVEEIARLAGFGSVAALRHHFSPATGLSPREYRDRFRHGQAASSS